MGHRKKLKGTETISTEFHIRRGELPQEAVDFLYAYAETVRGAKNRVSKRLYKSDELKYQIAYGLIKGNGIHAPFADLRQDCSANAFQKGTQQVVANFLTRLEAIEYSPSKKEAKAEPELVEIKKELIDIWEPTAEKMIQAVEKKKPFVSENRQAFLGKCVSWLKKNNGAFPLIRQLQQKYLNGLRKAVYKSLTFSTDNMLCVKQGEKEPQTFVERTGDNEVTLHFRFPEVRKEIVVREMNRRTGERKKAVRQVMLREEKSFDAKVRYREEYHGDLLKIADTQVTQTYKGKRKHFRNERNYTFVFNEDKNFRVVLTKERPEAEVATELPDNEEAFAGVDINFRDNALKLDDGWQIQWSPLLIKKVRKFLDLQAKRSRNIEANKNRDKDAPWGRKLRKLAADIRKMAAAEKNLMAYKLVRHLLKTGKKVLVAEDLEKDGWKIKGSFDKDTKNKTIAQLLGVVDWKHVLECACKKAGIVFALTNPMYTSQTCAKCGNIDADNRPFSERHKKDVFRCTRHDNNCHPDLNAARVIAGRMANPKIRTRLQWLDRKRKIWRGTSHKLRGLYQKIYAEAYAPQ